VYHTQKITTFLSGQNCFYEKFSKVNISSSTFFFQSVSYGGKWLKCNYTKRVECIRYSRYDLTPVYRLDI